MASHLNGPIRYDLKGGPCARRMDADEVEDRGARRRARARDDDVRSIALKRRTPLEFDVAQIRIEKNATARDAGIQMLLDAEDWKRVAITSPTAGQGS